MVELVEHGRTEVALEALLVRAGDEVLLGAVAEVRLEDARGADRQEVFVDDGVELDEAGGDQRFDVACRGDTGLAALLRQRVAEIAETGFADTCVGPENGDVNCRNVGYAENYFVHDASIYYYGDTWTIGGGLRNVLNEEPPMVDGASVFSFNNVPFGAGYDVLGRTLFANVVYSWQ